MDGIPSPRQLLQRGAGGSTSPHSHGWLCPGYSKTRIFRALLRQHTAGGSAYLCDCVPASHVLVIRSEIEGEE